MPFPSYAAPTNQKLVARLFVSAGDGAARMDPGGPRAATRSSSPHPHASVGSMGGVGSGGFGRGHSNTRSRGRRVDGGTGGSTNSSTSTGASGNMLYFTWAASPQTVYAVALDRHSTLSDPRAISVAPGYGVSFTGFRVTGKYTGGSTTSDRGKKKCLDSVSSTTKRTPTRWMSGAAKIERRTRSNRRPLTMLVNGRWNGGRRTRSCTMHPFALQPTRKTKRAAASAPASRAVKPATHPTAARKATNGCGLAGAVTTRVFPRCRPATSRPGKRLLPKPSGPLPRTKTWRPRRLC